MTIEEAIEYNKNLRMYMKISDKTQPCKFLKENHIALDMAIKNLEAWGKVREEIKYHADNIKYTDAYRDGFEVSLNIIDEHLKEVENGRRT